MSSPGQKIKFGEFNMALGTSWGSFENVMSLEEVSFPHEPYAMSSRL